MGAFTIRFVFKSDRFFTQKAFFTHAILALARIFHAHIFGPHFGTFPGTRPAIFTHPTAAFFTHTFGGFILGPFGHPPGDFHALDLNIILEHMVGLISDTFLM